MNEYHLDAFDNETSLLYALKKAGYATYAYLFKKQIFYPSDMVLFDFMISLTDDSVIAESLGYENAFRMVWIYRMLPSFLSKRLLPEEDLKSFLDRKMLPSHFELLSYYGMVDFIRDERFLPGHSRYTFLHVLLPHRPYVLCADCSYSLNEGDIEKTSGEEQAACTTNLIVEFVDVLKKLGRYKSSLIVIHADHGRRLDLSDLMAPALIQDASQALLMIKPFGNDLKNGFVVSDYESMLIDIAPTILDSIGVKSVHNFQGASLMEQHSKRFENRHRTFMIYDDKLHVYYLVKDGEYFVEKVVKAKQHGRAKK